MTWVNDKCGMGNMGMFQGKRSTKQQPAWILAILGRMKDGGELNGSMHRSHRPHCERSRVVTDE